MPRRRRALTVAATLQLTIDVALEHYRERRFAEARQAFLEALADAPEGERQSNIEFNVAACDYELGNYRDAERRFVELAERAPGARGEALLRAGWAALGAGDAEAAQEHLAASNEYPASSGRTELENAIARHEQERAVGRFEAALARQRGLRRGRSGQRGGGSGASTAARVLGVAAFAGHPRLLDGPGRSRARRRFDGAGRAGAEPASSVARGGRRGAHRARRTLPRAARRGGGLGGRRRGLRFERNTVWIDRRCRLRDPRGAGELLRCADPGRRVSLSRR